MLQRTQPGTGPDSGAEPPASGAAVPTEVKPATPSFLPPVIGVGPFTALTGAALGTTIWLLRRRLA